MRTRFPIIALLALFPITAQALEFEDGLAAYKRGELKHAVRIFTMLAERGDPPAQFALGMLYDKGNGVERDNARAAEWYTRSAESGYARAQLNLSLMYASGEGVEKDESLAHRWLREAAMQGNEDAVARLEENAAGDDPDAQFDLAGLYATGTGVDKDEAEARKWFQRAAADGDERSQFNLGVLAAAAGDDEEAVRWYEKAAKQQHSAAAYNLALLYLDGTGGNDSRAMALLRQAAEAGISGAQYQLGLMLSDEGKSTFDLDAAMKWFERAARSGHVPSQVNLGTILATHSPDADARVTACAWYMIAAENSPVADRNLDRLTARLGKAEIDRARAMLPRLLQQESDGDT
jgi:hypothetical protein